MQYGTITNPSQVRKGDSISIKHRSVKNQKTGKTEILVSKSRKVHYAGFCPSNPECVHLDSECYDTRFTTVVKVV